MAETTTTTSHLHVRSAAVIPALQARLDALYDECGRCSAASPVTCDEASFEANEARWADLDIRAERTRKALVRAQHGKPYWRVCREWLAGLKAEGIEFTPSRGFPPVASANPVHSSPQYR